MVFKKRDLFVTDFWEFDFPYHTQFKSQILDYIRSDTVQEYIKQASSSNPSVSSYGGHEITIQDNYIISFLETQVLKFLKKIEETHDWEEADWNSFDSWININSKGEFNPPHVHPGQSYSGVYYVFTPDDSGMIHFLDPRNAPVFSCPDPKFKAGKNVYGGPNPYDHRVFSHLPKGGQIIIFPSWLTHYVDPNPTDKHRVSIAFNIKYGNH